jgi:hypothetical protein
MQVNRPEPFSPTFIESQLEKMSIPRVRPLLAKIADLITHHTCTNSEKSAINYTLKP